jgi:hypothetical protein
VLFHGHDENQRLRTLRLSDLRIEHAGRSGPVGVIELTAPASQLNVRSGSGLLLRILNS